MTEEAVAAFEEIKQKLTSPPILAFADYSQPFELHTDASVQGLCAVSGTGGKTQGDRICQQGFEAKQHPLPSTQTGVPCIKMVSV